MSRTPPQHLSPKTVMNTLTPRPGATTLTLELVTPMYGGGVKTHTVDETMPIRASAIRGQLRFWWRLLAKHVWELGNAQAIRKAEAEIWGGIGEKTTASKVFLWVDSIDQQEIAAWATYNINPRNGQYRSLPDPEKWANVPYALFPAQGKRPGGNDAEAPHGLAKAGLTFCLHVRLESLSKPQTEQVWESIRWWSQFGGVGARTRRGLGAVWLKEVQGPAAEHLQTVVTAAQAQQAGCQLINKGNGTTAYNAWLEAVGKLQKFRQSPPLARNPGSEPNRPGRSKWPEPDAIRRLKSTNAPQHPPQHAAGNIFPRAAFGMPIIFHFKDRGEPQDTSLQPVINASTKDRMASPLILRPFHTGNGKWAAAALLLPHDHLNGLQLKLVGHGPDKDAVYWNPAKANVIEPIRNHGGGDPLQAFMTYFAK